MPAASSADRPRSPNPSDRFEFPTTGIVLAGGRSTRFGADKLAIEVGGRSLLAHTTAAVAAYQAIARDLPSVAALPERPVFKTTQILDRYGNTSAASVPIALAEAVESGRVKVGDRLVFVAFGAGFTSGAVALEWTADPARSRLADAIRPQDVRVRTPVDWDAVDPVPPALAEILARPGPVPLDLDAVVPDEVPAKAPAEASGVAPREARGVVPSEAPAVAPDEVGAAPPTGR